VCATREWTANAIDGWWTASIDVGGISFVVSIADGPPASMPAPTIGQTSGLEGTVRRDSAGRQYWGLAANVVPSGEIVREDAEFWRRRNDLEVLVRARGVANREVVVGVALADRR